jgi:hypothetical protein
VRFDDRLLTVLNQPAEDRHDVAVRWRQLVDLVARAGANSGSPVVADAIQAIRSEAHRVEEPLRAAAARAVAALPLPLGLLEHFAGDSLAVAAPVLAAATLDPSQWSALRAAGDEETRAFIDTLHPEVTAPPNAESAHGFSPPAEAPAAPEPAEAAVPAAYAPPSLHDVVERIEQRRRIRTGEAPLPPPRVAAKAPALFRWECGPGGEIAWVEGAPRGALIGRSIARAVESDGDRVDQQVVRAFAMRAPFRDALLTLAAGGPVSGEWKISGVPAFDTTDGRFAGYRGVALRETPPPAEAAPKLPTELLGDPDSLRELVHEIKTPLNAIIGFAEIIEGQYLGPADRGYRERAGEIVRQARLLVTAIDDLDFAAKVHSAGGARERVDLAALVDREAPELRELARKKRVELDFAHSRFQVPARVQAELADRLLFRLFGALVEVAEAGERLPLSVDLSSDGARISIGRPAALDGMSDAEPMRGTNAGNGRHAAFTLRLVRGLARIAGGDLVSGRDAFALVFPRA